MEARLLPVVEVLDHEVLSFVVTVGDKEIMFDVDKETFDYETRIKRIDCGNAIVYGPSYCVNLDDDDEVQRFEFRIYETTEPSGIEGNELLEFSISDDYRSSWGKVDYRYSNRFMKTKSARF